VIIAHRITMRAFAHDPLDGEGARRWPGRWNRRGTPVVYASSTLSLAVLEVLVHTDEPALLAQYVAFEFTFREKDVIDVDHLPDDWRHHPVPPTTRAIGDAWARSRASSVLRVPSAVLPQEFNYVINPMHSRVGEIEVSGPGALDVDGRVFGEG